eukprot:CAMPEP_0173100170 /NCGR_PEP_ID=MMETSP1102-20130122/36030_1 /TAXON_ID=49646 /ORGANISM="Geminigera sp., Strain Caron Lab Isolate" /LENGTH=751 /DNA_ID=CAMNT_0013993533 /DNA_START=63 /DNA_END=2318 /DNA_ORIENTATION=+
MSKKKGPTSSDLRKVGNVKVPTDWQPFGGFEDLESDDDSEMQMSMEPQFKRTFHAEIVSLQSPSSTTVPRYREIYLLQASLSIQSNIPDGTRVVLKCKHKGRSLVLCHFRVGAVETVVLGQLEFQHGDTYELSIAIQSSSASLYNLEVHVSGYQSQPAILQGPSSSDEDGDDDDDDEEEDVEKETAIDGYLEDDEPQQSQQMIQAGQSRSQALTAPEDVPPVSPLCIRIQVHAEGITEALLFHVDLLASAIRQAVIIKDHKSFLKVHPNTFRGQAAIEWLRGHAARALFGSEAEKEKNQQLSRSVALLLGQKLLAVGVFRQVTGSLTKPLEDPNALFRFHEDEKEGPLLNCRSIWFQNAREPLLVVSELLYTMLNLRLSLSQRGQDLKDSEELNNFTAAAAELQLVNINDLSRIQLLAFFLNAYNLMVLHAHVVRGSNDNTDFKSQKIPFTRDNQYMIAAYNYSLAEIEERLFCRVLRAKFPKKSDKSRAPEPRVHFALSLGCASSPRIRIYQPESLDEDLQQAAIEYLQSNCPKNQVRMQKAAAAAASGKRIHEVVLPKLFKWYKDDFGFSKQEILAYYASFMPDNMREELMEVARSNNFIIKYDKFDWNLHLTKACSEASRQPQRLITNHSPASRAGQQGDPAPTTLGANQVFTPSLHEVQGHTNISDKVYNQHQQQRGAPSQQGQRPMVQEQQPRGAPQGFDDGQRNAYRVPAPGQPGAQQPGAQQQRSKVPGLQDDSNGQPMDGFMC